MSNKYQNPNLVIKNVIYLFVRLLFVLIMAFYTTRLTLQVLGDEKFGIYNIVGGIITVFAIISMPIVNSLQRFFNVEFSRGIIDQNVVFNTSFKLILMMMALIAVLYETIGLYFINEIIQYPVNEKATVNIIFQILVLANLFQFLTIPYVALLFSKENMGIPATCEIIASIMKLALLFVILFIPIDVLIPYSCILFLVYFLQFVFYCVYCYIKYDESHLHNNIDVSLQKSMLSFSGWNFIESVAGISITYISNIFINVFGGILYNTAYGISKQLSSAVLQFSTSVLKAADPQITSSTATDNTSYRNRLVMTTMKISFLGIAFICIAFQIDGMLMLDIWLDKVPDYVFEFCELSLVGAVFSSIILPFRTLILATGQIKKFFLWYGILSLLAMLIMFSTLKSGMPVITAMYIIVIYGFATFLLAIFTAVRLTNMHLSMIFRELGRALIALVLCAFVYIVCHSLLNNDLLGLFISILLSFTSLIISSYMLAFDESEKNKVKNIIRKIKK